MNLRIVIAIECLIFHISFAKSYSESLDYRILQKYFYPSDKYIQPLIEIRGNGTVGYVTRRSSPTLVLRQIVAYLQKLKIGKVTLITERKLYIIAHQWMHKFEGNYPYTKLQLFDRNFPEQIETHFEKEAYEYHSYNRSITIILLDPAAQTTHLNGDYGPGKVLIVGNCIPFVMKGHSPDIRTNTALVTSPVKHWINGHVPFYHVSFYNIHRSGTKYVAIPYGKVLKYGSWAFEVKAYQCYGYMKDKEIFAAFNLNQTEITSFKNQAIAGFGGDYMTSLQGYLKFRVRYKCRYPDGPKFKIFKDSNQENCVMANDITLAPFPPFIIGEIYHKYPTVFVDYIAFYVRYEDEQISFKDLFSGISFSIWMLSLSCIAVVNFCFLLIYSTSPGIQMNVKVRNKTISKFFGIITMHWLVFFQSEWQQCPTVSSKWTLCIFNIFLFIISNIYIPLFTKRIFSLKKLTPWDIDDFYIGNFGYSFESPFVAQLIYNYCYSYEDCIALQDPSMVAGKNYVLDGTTLFDNLLDVKWPTVVEIASVASKHRSIFRDIGPVEESIMRYHFSFKSEQDFDFLEIFHAVTLKMRETGSLSRLKKLHFAVAAVPASVPAPVSFSLVWPLLAILGFGIVATLIACLMEKLTHKPAN